MLNVLAVLQADAGLGWIEIQGYHRVTIVHRVRQSSVRCIFNGFREALEALEALGGSMVGSG